MAFALVLKLAPDGAVDVEVLDDDHRGPLPESSDDMQVIPLSETDELLFMVMMSKASGREKNMSALAKILGRAIEGSRSLTAVA